MKLLAFDTSSLACAAGVLNGEQLIARYEEQPREHTRLLMPMIQACLRDAGLKVSELDAIVLGNGPGSFIGMRISASVAQGLAFGAGLAVVPVSSMAAVAVSAGKSGDVVAVAQDAHMSEVYLGLYRLDTEGLTEELLDERLQAEASIPEFAIHGPVVTAGAGWRRFPELLERSRTQVARESEILHPNAESLLALGRRACLAGEMMAPTEVNPAYLRQKVAEKPVLRKA